jgi:DNA-binding transcriptional ArsR family regulator
MRKAVVSLLPIALLVLAAVPAQALDLEFASPGEAGGRQVVSNATWFVVFFQTSDRLEGNVSFPQPVAAENVTGVLSLTTQFPDPPPSADPVPGSTTRDWQMPPSSMAVGLGTRGMGHLLVRADRIRVEASGAAALHSKPAFYTMQNYVGDQGLKDYQIPWAYELPGPTVVTSVAPMGDEGRLALKAEGVRFVQWAGAAPDCRLPDSQCPRGGGYWTHLAAPSPAVNVTARSFAVESFRSSNGTVDVGGSFSFVMVAGSPLDYEVDGWLRMPLARSGTPCQSCPANQTLWATGRTRLRQLAFAGDDRLAAALDGNLTAARLDEQRVDPAGLLPMPGVVAATAVVGAVGVGFAARFLFPLLTRNRDPLAHPRRRTVYDFIQGNPGMNFRELGRRTGIPTGTLAHHLRVLKRADLLMEKVHGPTRRFFENHGRHENDWKAVIVLREPGMVELYSCVKRIAPCNQRTILDEMALQGWSRSTAQHRLDRLTEGGLLRSQWQGRMKFYALPDVEAPNAKGSGASNRLRGVPARPVPSSALGGINAPPPSPL